MTASPALLSAARAIWDRGRSGGNTFDELSENQRADLIADAAAAIRPLLGRSVACDRQIRLVLAGADAACASRRRKR